jgi:hypothetical protein
MSRSEEKVTIGGGRQDLSRVASPICQDRNATTAKLLSGRTSYLVDQEKVLGTTEFKEI